MKKFPGGNLVIPLNRPLILASGSPRRKEILETMGIPYSVDVSDVDESFSASPEDMVLELSVRKAGAVAARHENALVLAADTLVFGDEVLGKPKSAEHAIDMLSRLSGNWHSVYTGLTLIDTVTGTCIRRADQTRVHFVELSSEDITAYVASGESSDKAGAYGAQGIASVFVESIEGDFFNVMGLPVCLLDAMLKKLGKGFL